MILALLGILLLDDMLDQLRIGGTFLQTIFAGRDALPRGLIMLAAALILIGIAARELYHLFHAKGVRVDTFLLAVSGMLGCTMVYVIPAQADARETLALMTSCMILIFMLSLLKYSWAHRQTDGAIGVAAATMFAFIYIGALPGFFIAIRRWHSAWIIIGILLIIKVCDIGAYFTGRLLGRNKLVRWLSPKKTWEGLVGGLIASGLVAMGLAWLNNNTNLAGIYQLQDDGTRVFLAHHFNVPLSFLGGVLLGAAGQLGDLTASIFKRDAGLKDSGDSIPGFGGLIDVIDSPLLAAPVAFWLLWFGVQSTNVTP